MRRQESPCIRYAGTFVAGRGSRGVLRVGALRLGHRFGVIAILQKSIPRHCATSARSASPSAWPASCRPLGRYGALSGGCA